MRASSECSSSSLLLSPCLQNIWIRYSAVGFVCGIAQEMGDIDTACFLTPRLEGYLRQPVMDLSNHYLLLSTLKDPLLRPVYDYVLKQSHLQEFFDWWASNTCSCTCVSCVHVCMCVLCACVSCVHVCMCVLCACVHVCLVCMCTCVSCVHVCLVCMCVLCACVHVCLVCMCACVSCVHVCMCVLCACVHVCLVCMCVLCACVHVCMCTCVSCVHVCLVCMCVYECVCMHVRVHVYMCACVFVCVYSWCVVWPSCDSCSLCLQSD